METIRPGGFVTSVGNRVTSSMREATESGEISVYPDYGRNYSTIILDDLTKEGNMIDEKITVNKIDDHYYIQIGCRETIVHDKKEALKWLGKLWDEHIKEK